jgi:hypothetical protein
MCVLAGGYIMEGDNLDAEPFEVQYHALADAPVRMVERGFAIARSVKDYGE